MDQLRRSQIRYENGITIVHGGRKSRPMLNDIRLQGVLGTGADTEVRSAEIMGGNQKQLFGRSDDSE